MQKILKTIFLNKKTASFTEFEYSRNRFGFCCVFLYSAKKTVFFLETKLLKSKIVVYYKNVFFLNFKYLILAFATGLPLQSVINWLEIRIKRKRILQKQKQSRNAVVSLPMNGMKKENICICQIP